MVEKNGKEDLKKELAKGLSEHNSPSERKKFLEILVVEDKEENLNVAKEAAKIFEKKVGTIEGIPIHFNYTTLASEAIKGIKEGKYDGIVTDLFFKGEDIGANEEYDSYIKILENSRDEFSDRLKEFDEGIQSLRYGKPLHIEENKDKAIDFIKDKIRYLMKKLEENPEPKTAEFLKNSIKEWESVINKLKSGDIEPEFAYGLPITKICEEKEIPVVLFSETHRHKEYDASQYTNISKFINAFMIMDPLKNIISREEVLANKGLHYYGSSTANKRDPECWLIAYESLIPQLRDYVKKMDRRRDGV